MVLLNKHASYKKSAHFCPSNVASNRLINSFILIRVYILIRVHFLGPVLVFFAIFSVTSSFCVVGTINIAIPLFTSTIVVRT